MVRIIRPLGVVLSLFLFFSFLYLFQSFPKTRFELPELTKEDRKMIKKAIKFHGDFPIVREGEEGKFYMIRNGKRIKL